MHDKSVASNQAVRHFHLVNSAMCQFYSYDSRFGPKSNRIELDRLAFDQPVSQVLKSQGKTKACKSTSGLKFNLLRPSLHFTVLPLLSRGDLCIEIYCEFSLDFIGLRLAPGPLL